MSDRARGKRPTNNRDKKTQQQYVRGRSSYASMESTPFGRNRRAALSRQAMAEASRESHGDKSGTGCQTERSEPQKKPGRRTTEAIRRTTDRAPEGDGGRETGRHGDKQGRLQTNLARLRAFPAQGTGQQHPRPQRSGTRAKAGTTSRATDGWGGQNGAAHARGRDCPAAGTSRRNGGNSRAAGQKRPEPRGWDCGGERSAEPEGTVPGRRGRSCEGGNKSLTTSCGSGHLPHQPPFLFCETGEIENCQQNGNLRIKNPQPKERLRKDISFLSYFLLTQRPQHFAAAALFCLGEKM